MEHDQLPDDPISRAELAQILGFAHVQSVARAHARGSLDIPYFLIRGRAIYSMRDVHAYIARQRRQPTAYRYDEMALDDAEESAAYIASQRRVPPGRLDALLAA